jgi:hypothetical protein
MHTHTPALLQSPLAGVEQAWQHISGLQVILTLFFLRIQARQLRKHMRQPWTSMYGRALHGSLTHGSPMHGRAQCMLQPPLRSARCCLLNRINPVDQMCSETDVPQGTASISTDHNAGDRQRIHSRSLDFLGGQSTVAIPNRSRGTCSIFEPPEHTLKSFLWKAP